MKIWRRIGIEPNEHQIPHFQGFSRQIIDFTRQTMGYSRQFMGIICPIHGVVPAIHGVFVAIHEQVPPIHRHHLPKPWGCSRRFMGMFSIERRLVNQGLYAFRAWLGNLVPPSNP
jgi:hypothetical protein